MALQKDVSLGEFLRYERELRGITIEQVASATKVGVRTLHALEADHYSELPAKPFVRGFVNSYCRFIGLDSKELLARFDDYINSKASERPNREAGHSGYAFEKRDGEQQSRTLLLVAMFGFVVVGGVAIVFLKPSFHHQRASHVDKLRAAHSVAGVESSLPDGKHEGISASSLAQLTQSSSSQSLLIQSRIDPVVYATGSSKKEIIVEPRSQEAKGADFKITEKEGVSKETPKTASEEPSKSNASNEMAKVEAKEETSKISDSSDAAKAEAKEEIKEETKEETPESNEMDPLDSGLTLKPSEIHHKVIFKVLADIWVRYKVDDRPIRKFIIRKGNSLVLRGREGVSVQVSNPKSVMFNYNSHGSRLLNSEKNHMVQQGNTSFFFPWKDSNKKESPFVGNESLPKTPDPSSDDEEGLAIGAKEPLSN